ncbi:MAG: biopolymer transporter ExbD [Lautropia sp.]
MASVQARGRSRGKRKLVNDINVVPYIDVMMVLLVIFMVTAPFVPTGTIELPRVGQTSATPERFIEIEIHADGKLIVETRKFEQQRTLEIAREALAETVTTLAGGNNDIPVVLSGDKAVAYEAILDVMDELQRLGRKRVGLMVKTRAP